MFPRLCRLAPFLICLPALADDVPAGTPAKPGHSTMGETFDEGPRQFAHLIPGASSVHFPVTTKSPEAQQFIDQGVTQLHGFWYFEAERSFRQAAWLDHDCAMAYWGMSMANPNNEKRALGFIREAVKHRATASPREQRWLDLRAAWCEAGKGDDKGRRARAVTAFEELLADFPEDLEARAFLLLQLWDNSTEGIPLPSRMAAAALADAVLADNPMHPGVHHYLIHLWNKDGTDKRALPDAARCGQSAPAIAHLWHMPGHTFSALKRYADAAWQQEASARVDHAWMREARLMPEQIFNYAHNNDWLAKDLGYVGRVHEAWALACNLVELPRLGPGKESAWRLGRARLLELGVTFELWDDLAALDGTPYLSPDADTTRETDRLRALALAWYGKGDLVRGAEKLSALEQQLAEARTGRMPAAEKAETEAREQKKSDELVTKAVMGALHRGRDRVETLEHVVAEVRTARALAMNDYTQAWEEFAKVHGLEPQREAALRMALGDFAGAEPILRRIMRNDAGQMLPRALLVQALERQGRKEEAEQAFLQLRSRAPEADLEAPAFARLAAIAARRGMPADWRALRLADSSAGVRPEQSTLGPFRWSPYAAPGFSLPDAERHPVVLEAHRERPVLVLFYLGAGCARCIQQLQSFAPAAESYAAAGIDIIAVSTDSPDGLKATFDQAKKGESFPFPIVSDEALEAFHAFRAFDDFENIPLHGAFLVDTQGQVRWQNISFEPFDEPQWLLGEAKRLLALPSAPGAIAGR